MIFKARPYQQYAIEQIIEKPKIGLMLDMGLGKSVITLTAIERLINDYFLTNRVLVIAPLRVAENTWESEIYKWEHLKNVTISKILGSEKERLEALKSVADIYIINRENVVWLIDKIRSKWDFDMVVIDESSSFKNHTSKRFKALRRVLPKIKRLVELTGTPAPNSMLDLWAQIYLLDNGARLGKTIGAFRKKYFTPGFSNGYTVYNWNMNKGADKEITKCISDICISMKSEDYLDLPDIIYNEVVVKLAKNELALYKKFEKDLVININENEIAATSAGVLSNKLLQMSNGFLYDENGVAVNIHNAKIDALKEIVEVNEQKSILVFYWFKHDVEVLKKEFKNAKELKSSHDIKDWNKGKIPILLVHPASAGYGLNLQYGGNIVVWYGLTWSLELYQQANKRLHRSGQTHNVIIHHLVAKGTIDEDVMIALKNKTAGQNKMLAAIKARIRSIAFN